MNKLRIKLLATALLAMPFFGMKAAAFEWKPVGDEVVPSYNDLTSYAIELTGTYVSGDIIVAAEGELSNGSFMAAEGADAADNTVDIYGTIDETPEGDQCPLKIDGDVKLGAVDANLIVNIKTPVTIEPYRPTVIGQRIVLPDAEGDGASVTFETVVDKTITVNVDYDLQFRGMTDDVTAGDVDGYSNLYLIFKGAGQTKFVMADGTVIKFDGQMDESAPAVIDETTGLITPRDIEADGDYSAEAGGTKVFVLMDQTAAQVNAGANKVLFERAAGDQRTMIYVGPNSVFTYLSDNYQGLATPDAEVGINADGKYYGAVGINPANTGTGRMVLLIKGAYKTGWQADATTDVDSEIAEPESLRMVAKYPFNDGALVIAGHEFIPTDLDAPFDTPADFRTATPDDVEAGYNYAAPAGVKAILRVVDAAAYSAAGRRGLLVINDCQNLGKYASDPYWDSYGFDDAGDPVTYGVGWAYLNKIDKNVRMGCVLGVNGILDIYDNTFLDYVGGASNEVDSLAALDFDLSYLKKHNASAFIVDGLDQSVFSYDNPFIGANSAEVTVGENALRPQIVLRGHAKAMFKNASVTTSEYAVESEPSSGFGTGYLVNFWARDPLAPSQDDPLADPYIDFNMALSLGPVVDGWLTAVGYDGYQLAEVLDENGVVYSKTGEGEIALDVEGPMVVTNTAANGSSITTLGDGVITLASVLTDHTGREINGNLYPEDEGYYISRPLLSNDIDTYVRYNSPGLFINDKVSLFNTTFAHTDATKFVTGSPENSEPAITGGERLFFANENFFDEASMASDPARYRYPEFRMFNSELALHETLCASGVRFVVMDIPLNYPTSSTTAYSNQSVVRFYDHGQDLDTLKTGYGRLFMLGSELNLMEGEIAGPNYVTQSAFLNVFKRNLPIGLTGSSTAKLSLRTGNEFPSTVATSSYARQRTQHYIWMGLPNTNVAYAQTGMFVGWPTVGDIDDSGTSFPVADSRSYPYPDEVTNEEDKDIYWFKLDSRTAATDLSTYADSSSYVEPTDLPAPKAELAIEGNNICINALTNAGAGALVPVKDATDSGNVYVDFGGAMTISQLPVDVRTVSSFNTSGINTSILAKEWNDYDIDGVYRPTWYSGYVNLPSNQVTFGSNYGIQPYGLTAAMVDANPTTYGFFRLPTSEEMTVAWFYRDPLFQQYMKSRTPATRPEYMMYVGAGNDVQQLRVSGATVNDPFCLDISGDGARPIVARVREFATLASTRTQKFVGEGQHGIIFAEFGGRFGLGSNEWNSNSLNAWNVLGEDYVTIAPLGNCTIDLNEDVIVADDLPFMAMKRRTTEDSAWGFGYPAVTDPFNTTSHRMTIRSETEREIRVLAGTILDLSGFGQGTVRQEIAFGGKVKLVLEEGAGIRFPAAADVDGGVVLYFNDESQLVFEGINEAMTASRYYTAADSDANRIKLLGKGQIWLNKNAKMKVMGTASVAVQADATTLATDITISLARQSQFLIGDSTLNGGAFQVGNTTAVTDATIDFALIINGADALFHTDREGFFGLGAGLINKPGSKPNGAAVLASNPLLVTTEVAEAALLAEQDYNLVVGKAKLDEDGLPVFSPDNLGTTQDDGSEFDSTAWQIIPLQNVRNITMTLTNGIIEHKSIVTGADSNSSLWAIGKFSGNGIFNLNGGSGAIIRGGGNVMLVPSTLPTDYSFIPVNMWDYVGAMANTGETYSILASAPSLSARVADLSTDNYAVNLTTGVTRFIFTTPASLFGFLGYKDYSTLGGTRYVALGATQFNIVAGYVNKDTQNAIYPVDMTRIMRVTNPTVSAGRVSDGLKYGVLSSGGSGSVNPDSFSVPSAIGSY